MVKIKPQVSVPLSGGISNLNVVITNTNGSSQHILRNNYFLIHDTVMNLLAQGLYVIVSNLHLANSFACFKWLFLSLLSNY